MPAPLASLRLHQGSNSKNSGLSGVQPGQLQQRQVGESQHPSLPRSQPSLFGDMEIKAGHLEIVPV